MLWTSSLLCLTLSQLPAPPERPPDPTRRWLKTLGNYMVESTTQTPMKRSESHEMLAAILSGSNLMGQGEGWFKASRSRFGFEWLAKHCGVDPDDERIRREDFSGPAELFTRLDRDRDGRITPRDLDWSDNSSYAKQMGMLSPWFRRLDGDSNGRISRQEWLALFESAAEGKDYLTPEDLRQALLVSPPTALAKAKKAPAKGAKPFSQMIMERLFQGELGSPYEGPRPGQRAPNFTLEKFDGKGKITLAHLVGAKPVVLIFGSFT